MKAQRMQNHQWDRSLDQEIVPLFLELQWAQARSLEKMRPLLQSHGLSAAEFDVLASLRNTPAPHVLTPSQLQQEMMITSGGLTKVMLQLEQRELVIRQQSTTDLRIKPVQLSPAGICLIETAMTEMVAHTGQWCRQALTAAEIAQLTMLLGKLVEG